MRKTKTPDAKAESEHRGLSPADVRGPRSWFEEMDVWFDDFRREFEGRFWGPLARWGQQATFGTRAPLVDLADAGREFLVKAELPGVSKEDLDIRVTEDGIEVNAAMHRDKEESEKGYYYRERSYRSFHRALAFPEKVLPDQAEAALKDGILEVRVPKKEPTAKQEPVRVRVD